MFLKHLRPLFPYLKKYRSAYVWGTICVFLHNGIWILFPLVIRRAIDDLRSGPITVHKLGVNALLLLAVAVIFITQPRAEQPGSRWGTVVLVFVAADLLWANAVSNPYLFPL